jgi:hypothetical protein
VVNVLWHPHQAPDRRRITELAADLANLVQEHLPETGHSVTIRGRLHAAWRSLPQEVASLSVVRRKSISKNSWTTVRGAFVPTLTPPELQQIMSVSKGANRGRPPRPAYTSSRTSPQMLTGDPQLPQAFRVEEDVRYIIMLDVPRGGKSAGRSREKVVPWPCGWSERVATASRKT